MSHKENDSQSELAGALDVPGDLIGTLLEGKIRIVSLLSSSTSVCVYKAQHLSLDRVVTVKVLQSRSADETTAQRFLNESKLLSSLNTEHIVKFLSYGILPDSRPYMVLEFVEGRSLDRLLNEDGPLATPRALRIFNQICKGLAEAHAQGIVHRDVKPASVIVSGVPDDEFVKIMDFGISKAIHSGRQDLTATGLLLGSANYMSPEQCRNESVDARSDIYSFACLMFECLVGRPPMQDTTDLSVMSNQLNKRIEKIPSKHRIPGELSRLILKCLHKAPESRYKDAAELASVLEGCPSNAETSIFESRVVQLSLLSGVLALGITLSAYHFKNKPGESIKLKYSSIEKLSSPAGVGDFQSMEETENWIKQKLKQKLSIAELMKVSDDFTVCLQFRKAHGLVANLDDWKKIETLLNAIRSPQDWADGQWHLANFYVSNGDTQKLLMTLTKFERQRSVGECGKLIDHCIEESKRENKNESRSALVAHFSQYAHEKKRSREIANSAYQKASLLLDSGKTLEAEKFIREMKKSLDDAATDLDFNEPEYARYCELLNRRARFLETLSIIKKILPEGYEQKLDEPIICLRLDEAAAHLGLGHAQKAATMCKDLLNKTLQSSQKFYLVDSVELQLLKSYQAEGKEDLLVPELKNYLDIVRKARPETFLDSLAYLNKNFLQQQKIFDASVVFSPLIKQASSKRVKDAIESEYQIYRKAKATD